MSARPMAARIPATPPPITATRGVVFTVIGSSAWPRWARAMPALTSLIAFLVAPSGSSVCVHEHCSRMLTWVTRYGFTPARSATPRKVNVCSLGEQQATTIPSIWSSWTSLIISCWLVSEQVNMACRATQTPAESLTASMTRSTST